VNPIQLSTNLAALQAQRAMKLNQAGLERSLSRLATGYRVSSAADDPGAVGVASRLEARARSFQVVERGMMVAVEMAKTAEGGSAEIVDTLQRMRELAVQASDGALTSTDRTDIDTEYQELLDEIDRLAGSTTYNDRELLAGTASTVDFRVGVDTTTDDVLSVGFGGVSASGLGVGTTLLTGTNATNATAAITAIDTALGTMGTKRARFGAAISRLGFALSNGQGMRSRLEASVAAIREVDLAEETTMAARYQILLEAGASALASAQGIRSQIVRALLGIDG